MSVEFERFDDATPLTGQLLAVGAAFVATVATAYSLAGVGLGLLGVVVLAFGVRRASRKLVTVGAVTLFGGVLVAGATGSPLPFVLLGSGATIVAWDAGTNAISVGSQLGTTAATRQLQVVHSLATAVVAAVVGGVLYGVYWLASGGQSTAAIALLLVAALVFSYVLDR